MTKSSAPSIPETRKALAREGFVRLVRLYDEARRYFDDFDARSQGDNGPEAEPWVCLAHNQLCDAEAQMVRAIVAWHRPEALFLASAERTKFPPMAVTVGGRTFAISAHGVHEDMEEGAREETQAVMELSVVGPADMTNFDGDVADQGDDQGDDQDEGDDEPDAPIGVSEAPTPSGPRPGRWGSPPPLPVFRSAMTFALPGDKPPITLQVIVISPEIFGDDEETARKADVPRASGNSR